MQIRAEESNKLFRYLLVPLGFMGLHPHVGGKFAKVRAAATFVYMLAQYSLTLFKIVLEYDGLRTLREAIMPLPASHQALLAIATMSVWKYKYAKVVTKIQAFWPDDVFGENFKNILDGHAKVFNTTCYASFSLVVVVVISKMIMSFRIRSYPLAWYIPCDMQKDLCYFSFLVIQYVYCCVLGAMFIGLDVFFFFLLFCACQETQKVKYRFENVPVGNGTSDVDTLKYFTETVKYHNFILDFVNDINDIFKVQLLNKFANNLASIFYSIFAIDMEGSSTSSESLTYGLFLLANCFQAAIYCAFGEILLDQLESVGLKMYSANWHVKFQPKLSRGVQLVIQRSQVTKKITIGGLCDLNLTTFAGILKLSMSVHTFMQKLYAK